MTSEDLLESFEVETHPRPKFSVIWLHGLGADGSDFLPIVPELGLPVTPGFRFIFPNAPEIPVTCNAGYVMPAWYDIISLERHARRVDESGIHLTRSRIRALLARENARGIASEHIFLAGFSQGGAIAYTTALTHPEPLAGVIALSTYIPSMPLIESEASSSNLTTPIFAAHGLDDEVVSPELGSVARDWLTARSYRVEWHEYPMAHSVCMKEVRDIGRWLKLRANALSTDGAAQ